MPSSPVLDLEHLSATERSVLRLDGEILPLGLTDVPVGVPLVPAVRAASLLPATGARDLVLELGAAAWVHGVLEALPDPLTLAVDIARVGRIKLPIPAPREVRYRPADLVRFGGVLVTTRLRTAFDLLRLQPGDESEALASALIRDEGVTPPIAAALAHLHLPCANKDRAIERLAALQSALLDHRGRPAAPSSRSGSADQPAETR